MLDNILDTETMYKIYTLWDEVVYYYDYYITGKVLIISVIVGFAFYVYFSNKNHSKYIDYDDYNNKYKRRSGSYSVGVSYEGGGGDGGGDGGGGG